MYSTYISNLDNIEGLGLNSSEIDFLGLVSADKLEVLVEDSELTERLQAVQFPNFNVSVGVIDDIDQSDSQEIAEVRDIFTKVRDSMQTEPNDSVSIVENVTEPSYVSNFTDKVSDGVSDGVGDEVGDKVSKDVENAKSNQETTHLNGLSVSDIELANSIGCLSNKIVSGSKKALVTTEAVAKNMFSPVDDDVSDNITK